MALTKTTIASNGLSAKNSIIRVTNCALVGKSKMLFLASFYINTNEQIPFDNKAFECPYDMDGKNPIAQAYEHLKTLPQFAGAADC